MAEIQVHHEVVDLSAALQHSLQHVSGDHDPAKTGRAEELRVCARVLCPVVCLCVYLS